MSAAHGGCLCGQLRYEVANQPARITMCHCEFCQRATGGPYLLEPVFDAAHFSMIKGIPKIYKHTSEGSGKQVYVNFCDTCGTKVFRTFERFKAAIGLYGGTLDDRNWLDVRPDNSKHIFLDVAQNETVVPAHIPTFEEHAMHNDGSPVEPTIFDVSQKIGDRKIP